jgi:hypothetical protein
MALKSGIMAYDVQKTGSGYLVTYDPDKSYKIWRNYNHQIFYAPGDTIFAYTSIFAPTALKESVAHRWMWYNSGTGEWETSDIITYNVTGGRDGGYRGYTYKTKLHPGQWEVDVITKRGLILGTMNFILKKDTVDRKLLAHKKFE